LRGAFPPRACEIPHSRAHSNPARQEVAKVNFGCGGGFPPVGFIVKNRETGSRAEVRFYNKLCTSDRRIK